MAQKKKNVHKKKPAVAIEETKKTNINKWLTLALFIALAVLIFYPPYVRGLFFNENIFIYHILTALVFIFIWVEKIRRRDYSFLRTPLDWAVLAYVAAYLLSLFGAVHPGEALYGFLRALNLFMVYWMVTRVVKDYQGYEKILQVLLASGAGVAAIGILAATGYSKYPAAFNGRAIYSTLQYSNSTAAFLAVMTLIGITLWVREENIGRKLIYGIVCFLMLLTVLGSLSKGAWLILLAGIILLVIGMPGIYRFRSVFYLGVAAGAAAITASRFIPVVTGENPSSGLALLWIGLVVVIVGQGLWEILAYSYRKNRTITIAAVLILLGIVVFLQPVQMDRLISITPDAIGTELKGIVDLQSNSYQARYDFARWGIAIVKDHSVVGTGAGGWNALYHQYQDYLIHTTEVHNHFIQVWVEAGTIGFIAFMAMWVVLLLSIFRLYQNYRKPRSSPNAQQATENWVLNWGVTSAALAFGLHAAMDFDLSLMALALVLWVLFALINAALIIERQMQLQELKPPVSVTLATIFALLLLFCGNSFTSAFNNSQAAGKVIEQMAKSTDVTEQNRLLAEAENKYIRATAGDSWSGMYHTNLAQVYAIRTQQFREANPELSRNYYQKAVSEIKKAERFSFYDIKVRNSLLDSSTRVGDMELIVHLAEGNVKSIPLDANAYNTLAQVLWSGTEAYLNVANYEAAGKLTYKLVGLEDKIQAQIKLVNADRGWQGAPLQFNPNSQLYLARGHYLLGNYDKALPVLAPVATEPNNLIWYAAALYKKGDATQAQQLMAGLEQSNPDLYKRYQELLEIPVLK
jgi:O-antigen ligase